ncbi:unnamed protein product [Schistosoma turkestanicum]|nr:unnamed protein product [Schistosoma turkestanicum]
MSFAESNISNFDKFLNEILDRISTIPSNILYSNYFNYSKLKQNHPARLNKVQCNETTTPTSKCLGSMGNHMTNLSNGNNHKKNKRRSVKISKCFTTAEVDCTHYLHTNIHKEHDLPGTWVECSFCSKWRYLPYVHDPSQLNDLWYCALNPKYLKRSTADSTSNESMHNPCEEPEDLSAVKHEDEFIFGHFSVGSVVWAKMQGYPDWPAMIYYNNLGRYAEFDASSKEITYYYVVFLDPKCSTMSKVRAKRIHKFTAFNEMDLSKIPKRYWRRLRAAGQEAENALLLSVKDRIATYGYNHKYEDHAVKISNQIKKSFGPYQKKSQNISNDDNMKQKRVYKRKKPLTHSCSINENANKRIDCQPYTNSNHTSNASHPDVEQLSNTKLKADTDSHKVLTTNNHEPEEYNKESNSLSLNESSIEHQTLDISLTNNNLLTTNTMHTIDVNVDQYSMVDSNIILNDSYEKLMTNDDIDSVDCCSPSFLQPIDCDQTMKGLICSVDHSSNVNTQTTDIPMNNPSINAYENNLMNAQNFFKLTFHDLSIYCNNNTVNTVNDVQMSLDNKNKNTVLYGSLNCNNKKILYENIPFYYQYFGCNEA